MSAPIETVLARIQTITDIAEKAAAGRSASYDDADERGEVFGRRKLAKDILEILQAPTEEPQPRETIKEINRRLRYISSVWSRDNSLPYEFDTEFTEGCEKGEISLAKEIRRVLNSPVAK